MVHHRNQILTHNIYHGFDLDGNGVKDDILIPANFVEPPIATGNTTEMQDLENGMTKLVDKATAEGVDSLELRSMMYPAASACYAYEPTASNLVDKFKKHNWFLPTTGHLTHLLYYQKLAISNGDKNIFDTPIFTALDVYPYTSQEYSATFFPSLYFPNSQYSTAITKNSSQQQWRFIIRPICAF